MGAYFGKSTIAWGMELEDRKFYGFKQWAKRNISQRETRRQAAQLGVVEDDGAPPGMNEEAVGEEGEEEGLAGGDDAAADGNATSQIYPSQSRTTKSAPRSSPQYQVPDTSGAGSSLRM